MMTITYTPEVSRNIQNFQSKKHFTNTRHAREERHDNALIAEDLFMRRTELN